MAVTEMTKLTLGPIAYHWSAETRRDFYARIADEAMPIYTAFRRDAIDVPYAAS